MKEDAVVQEVALYQQILVVFGLESDEKLKLRMRDSLLSNEKKNVQPPRCAKRAFGTPRRCQDSTVHE
jgi:hypothetical protein